MRLVAHWMPGLRMRGLGIGFALVVGALGAHAQEAEVGAVVDDFQGALVEAMRDGPSLGYDGRRERLAPVLDRTFDMPAITRLVFGKRWSTFDDERRGELRALVRSLALATLASRFTEHSGETFVRTETRPMKKQRMQVRSEFRPVDDTPVRIDYALHRTADGWRVLNVWFDGVSSTRINRDEFAALIDRDGIDGLVGALEEKISAYARGDIGG